MRQKSVIAWALFAAVSLSGPSLAADPHARYRCEDGSHFFVRFSGNMALVTLSDGVELALPQQRSGSGFWYSSGRHELRGKGNQATWTVGRKVPVKCLASG